jgi:hypothetical protein
VPDLALLADNVAKAFDFLAHALIELDHIIERDGNFAVESGQADLFLSGYLGIDFITRGLAVYRLLDPTRTGVTLDSLQRAASANSG